MTWNQIITAISDVVASGILLHLSYLLIIFMLFIEKRKAHLMLDLAIEKNLRMGNQLDGMRVELKALHLELVQLIKENHSLNVEIQLLTTQVNKLREEVQKTKV